MADQARIRHAISRSFPKTLFAVSVVTLLLAPSFGAQAQVVERGDAPPAYSSKAEATVESVSNLTTNTPSLTDQTSVVIVSEDTLQPLTIDEEWSPLQFDLKDVVLPTENVALISYLSEGYHAVDAELSIDDAVAYALEHNHDVNSKRLNAIAACQSIDINWAALKPQVSLQSKVFMLRSNAKATTVTVAGKDGEEDQTFSFGGTEESPIGSLALSLTQRIYDWGLTNRLIDASRAQFSIQNFTVDIAEQQLVTNVVSSYYQFSAALGQARIRRDELRLAQEFLRQAQIQFDVGTVPRLDVIRAEARVEQARDGLIASLSNVGNAAARFYSLLGVEDQRYVPAVITTELIDLGAEPPPVSVVSQTAVNTRPEVQLQYTTLLAGQAKIDLSKNRPILQGYANTMLQDPPITGSSVSAEYGVQLLWNVYTGGKERLERKQAETEFKAMSEAVLDLEAKIELDATTSWNRTFAARAAVSSAKKTLELSGEALRAASVGYAAGVTPYIDFQSALDTNVAAALGYLVALIEVKLARVDLERAQGFPAGYPGDSRAGLNGERSVNDVISGSPTPLLDATESEVPTSPDTATSTQ